MTKWTEENIPSLDNKNVIVTGANSGIGFQAAKKLALKGARVIMACRNAEKAARAADMILKKDRGADVEYMHLDLSSLASVSKFAEEYKGRYKKLDILINNAGVMATPYRRTTDGFEWQFGINHLGHFALTGQLLESLNSTPGSRVVTVTSIAHFKGRIHFEDLSGGSWYHRMRSYRQSKLANLLFAYELQRRLTLAGSSAISVAAHPGISATSIVWLPFPVNILKDLVLMKASKGALPIVMAATDERIEGGEYLGPAGPMQSCGAPAILKSGRHSYDRHLWQKLWKVSEELTGINYLDKSSNENQ